MLKDFNPRDAVRGLLQGIAPPRPLFLPIVFSLGARIENVSPRNFLTNPTKISNALRQIRAHVRSDGVTCYFDPYLEAEALGGVLDWDSDSRSPRLRWPQPSQDGELPEGLSAPEETATRGRVPIAAEVIRRLKPVVRDNFLLVAGVTGHLTLAATLAQADLHASSRKARIPESALNLAGEVVPVVARTLVEAGANVIFIREESLPSSEDLPAWISGLAPIVNIVRFYEALPILLLNPGSASNIFESISRDLKDCVICAPLAPKVSAHNSSPHGIALPASAFESGWPDAPEFPAQLQQAIQESRPAIVTTTTDLAPSADLKYLNTIAEIVNC